MSGSISVVRQLLAARLLDELHLLLHPIAVRKGMRLFDEGEPSIPLRLIPPNLQDRRLEPRLRAGSVKAVLRADTPPTPRRREDGREARLDETETDSCPWRGLVIVNARDARWARNERSARSAVRRPWPEACFPSSNQAERASAGSSRTASITGVAAGGFPVPGRCLRSSKARNGSSGLGLLHCAPNTEHVLVARGGPCVVLMVGARSRTRALFPARSSPAGTGRLREDTDSATRPTRRRDFPAARQRGRFVARASCG